ncbi:MAG: hypothetical protein KDK91_29295 [Gammaproteobacteria bacterium]|nr:hypothetical protein [Gammaproteobacteria bacterium]
MLGYLDRTMRQIGARKEQRWGIRNASSRPDGTVPNQHFRITPVRGIRLLASRVAAMQALPDHPVDGCFNAYQAHPAGPKRGCLVGTPFAEPACPDN